MVGFLLYQLDIMQISEDPREVNERIPLNKEKK